MAVDVASSIQMCVCVRGGGGDIRYNGLYGEAPFDRRRDFAPVKYNL